MYRIAFLIARSDQIGGAHTHVRDLAVALQNDGHRVTVFMGGDGPVIDHFKKFGVTVVKIPSVVRNITLFQDIRSYYHLKQEIASFKPDIITAHSSKTGFLGRIIAWRLGIPVMFTAHGWSFTDGKSKFKQAVYRMLERIVIPITDKIVAVSDYDRNLGMEQLSLSENQIITIHNGIPDIDKKFMSDQESKAAVNIVMVARFDHQKDQQELLKATYNIENIHLHFVGDGHLRVEVERLAGELNMQDKITFWGELDSVDEILARSQIFVLTSNWEGFPCSTLEAMRAGLPTVVSDVGGAAEAIDEGVTGYAVKKGDVEELHKIVEELVNNHGKRKKIGKAARERFKKLYTFDMMYKKNLQVYESLIKK